MPKITELTALPLGCLPNNDHVDWLAMQQTLKGKKKVIEAGHFYLDTGADAESTISAEIAVRLSKLWEGDENHHMIFIDDLLEECQQNNSLDVIAALAQPALNHLVMTGFIPHCVYYESWLIQTANDIIAELDKKGKVKEGKDGKKILKGDGVSLTEKDGNPDWPNCATLDAALYLYKLQQYDASITVLSSYYLNQQSKTHKILTALGVHYPPVTVALFNEQAALLNEVSQVFMWDWSKPLGGAQ